MSIVLFFKSRVGAYLRGGKLVNLSGYQGRAAHGQAAPGQMSLFGGPESGKPLPPSPLQGKDAVTSTPDMFSEHPPEKVAWAKKVIANRDHMPWQDVQEAHRIMGVKDEDAEWAKQKIAAAKPTSTAHAEGDKWVMPIKDAIAEHKELAHVAATPSKADDKAELAEQKGELKRMESAASNPQADYRAASTSSKQGPTDEEAADPRRKYYVTIAREGRGVSKLAGPFDTHDEAKAHVERARDAAYKVDPRSAFDAFGTSGVVADVHKPGVLNQHLGIGAKAAPYVAQTDDSHPAPTPRGMLSLVPEDKRAEWLDRYRQQHELHHYELGQVREKMDRARSKRNKAETEHREAEAALKMLRGAPVPDPAREREAEKHVDAKRNAYDKTRKDLDALTGQHQALYERVAKMGRDQERIYGGSGDMDLDMASMRKRDPEAQRQHEASMLKLYRDHYKAKDAKPKAKVTPQVASAKQLDGMIKIAADSVEKLRRSDVDRVIGEAPAHFRRALAEHIKSKRSDLADEVNDVMADATMTKSVFFMRRTTLAS